MLLQPTYCLITKPGNEISYEAYVNPLGKVCTVFVHCVQIGFKKIIFVKLHIVHLKHLWSIHD